MMLPSSPRPPERALLDDVLGAAGVHEDRHAELGGLGPERVVLRQRQILAVHVPADRGAAQAETLDAILQLFGGQLGMLQRDRRRRDKPIGMRRHPLREPLVLRETILRARSAIRGVPPEVVDGQRLHVDALLIHDLQPLRAEQVVAAAAAHLRERRAFGDVLHGNDAVRVTVDDADAPAADRHLPARRDRQRRCARVIA